jgi:hypothetical protein
MVSQGNMLFNSETTMFMTWEGSDLMMHWLFPTTTDDMAHTSTSQRLIKKFMNALKVISSQHSWVWKLSKRNVVLNEMLEEDRTFNSVKRCLKPKKSLCDLDNKMMLQRS